MTSNAIKVSSDSNVIHFAAAKDARGYKLLRDCGYLSVWTCAEGWRQIGAVIADAETKEALAAMVSA